jgi:hypothetical protein
MYRFLQTHSKKIMAVLGAFLMVVFIVDFRRPRSRASDFVIGKVAGVDVNASEVHAASSSWEYVNRHFPGLGGMVFGPQMALNVKDHPEILVLLQREAQQMGVQADTDDVNSLLEAPMEGQARIPRGETDQARRAISDVLRMAAAFEQAASAVKVSEPAGRRALAAQQYVKVNLVEFAGETPGAELPAPTPQQLEEQFRAYAEIAPGSVIGDAGSQGFAYRYPDRVKLQYIQIPREQVRKSVEGGKPAERWEVEARKYYLKNQAEFAAVPEPTTQPTTAPSTAPTTRPFEQVRAEAMQRVIDPLVEQQIAQLQSMILTRMQADRASAGPPPATQSAGSTTAPADGYYSADYLPQLAKSIQERSGVLPTVMLLTDAFRSADELRLLDGVGQAFGASVGAFGQYAIAQAELLLSGEAASGGDVLSLYEPSVPLRDGPGNVFVFRLTDVDPAHTPKDISEIADRVERDWKRKQRFDQAKIDAQRLFEQATQQGLVAAAEQGNRKLITTGYFPSQPGSIIPGYMIFGPSQARFIEKCFDLLSATPPRPEGRPITLVELPREGKVLVVEFADIRAPWGPLQADLAMQSAERAVLSQRLTAFRAQWFDYQAVKQRMAYQPSRKERSSDDEAPEPPSVPQPLPIGA